MIGLFSSQSQTKYDQLVYDFSFQDIDGKALKLDKYLNIINLISIHHKREIHYLVVFLTKSHNQDQDED